MPGTGIKLDSKTEHGPVFGCSLQSEITKNQAIKKRSRSTKSKLISQKNYVSKLALNLKNKLIDS
jgi:hypothetical protein